MENEEQMSISIPSLDWSALQPGTPGILRSVARQFKDQRLFKSLKGGRVTIPTYQVSAQIEVSANDDAKRQEEDLSRAAISARCLLYAEEDRHLFDLVEAVSKFQPTEGILAPKAVMGDDPYLLSKCVADLVTLGRRVSNIYFNPRDYARLLLSKDQYHRETSRAVLETGLMGYYQRANLWQNRKVEVGTVYVFAQRTAEETKADPDVADVIMTTAMFPRLSISASGEGVLLRVDEEIGMCINPNFVQKISIAR